MLDCVEPLGMEFLANVSFSLLNRDKWDLDQILKGENLIRMHAFAVACLTVVGIILIVMPKSVGNERQLDTIEITLRHPIELGNRCDSRSQGIKSKLANRRNKGVTSHLTPYFIKKTTMIT